jgi:hypothetical protein
LDIYCILKIKNIFYLIFKNKYILLNVENQPLKICIILQLRRTAIRQLNVELALAGCTSKKIKRNGKLALGAQALPKVR